MCNENTCSFMPFFVVEDMYLASHNTPNSLGSVEIDLGTSELSSEVFFCMHSGRAERFVG